MYVALRLEKLDRFPKCELGSGVLRPTSDSNGFSAVKVGEGDCRRVLQRNKISSGEAQEDLDGHGNYFELIYFYRVSHSRIYFPGICDQRNQF